MARAKFQRVATHAVLPRFYHLSSLAAEGARPAISTVGVPPQLAEKFSDASGSFLQNYGYRHEVPFRVTVHDLAARTLQDLDRTEGFIEEVKEQGKKGPFVLSGVPLGTTPVLEPDDMPIEGQSQEQLKAAGTPILFINGLLRSLGLAQWDADPVAQDPGYLSIQSRGGRSSDEIIWHCDMPMYGSAKPVVTSLTCLNSEGNVRTAFLPAEKIFHALSPSSQEILQEKMFALDEGKRTLRSFAVFEVADDGQVSMTFEPQATFLLFAETSELNHASISEAVWELQSAVLELGKQAPAHALKPGEALVFKNSEGAHARLDQIPPEESRWLVREQWRREVESSRGGQAFAR